MGVVIKTEAMANANGALDVHLPDATTKPFARVTLHVEIAEIGKSAGRFSKRFATKEEYRAAMDRVFGGSDDPTFLPPEDQPVQDVEPL